MFSLKQIKTITLASLAGTLLLGATVDAQQSEFSRRAEAMQRARSRYAAAPVAAPAGTRIASNDMGQDNVAPPAPVRRNSATRSRTKTSGPVARTAQATSKFQSTGRTRRQQPAGARVAQNLDSVIIDDGSMMGGPIVGSPYAGSQVVGGPAGGAGCGNCGTGNCGCSTGGYVGSGYVDEGYYETDDGGCGCGESFFDSGCGDDSCCGRGGCPPGDCWLAGLGGILAKGEYFGGATAFQGPMFQDPNGTTQEFQDCNFGFYGGVNFGVPLCRLTCGVLSGQVGVRSVQTNFNGNEFTAENRDQLFVTAGIYRRVDYGFQFGIVADYLQDDWFTEASITQLRTDLGWVFAGGATMGFRYTAAQDDDITAGTIAGGNFNSIEQSVYDQYRFYLNSQGCCGGIGELFAGWTEFDQTILGVDFDMPIRERVAVESSFTYFLSDQQTTAPNRVGGNQNEAWNLSVGIVLRPQGRAHYKSYDRPMFDVADNGTMLIRRN